MYSTPFCCYLYLCLLWLTGFWKICISWLKTHSIRKHSLRSAHMLLSKLRLLNVFITSFFAGRNWIFDWIPTGQTCFFIITWTQIFHSHVISSSLNCLCTCTGTGASFLFFLDLRTTVLRDFLTGRGRWSYSLSKSMFYHPPCYCRIVLWPVLYWFSCLGFIYRKNPFTGCQISCFPLLKRYVKFWIYCTWTCLYIEI